MRKRKRGGVSREFESSRGGKRSLQLPGSVGLGPFHEDSLSAFVESESW